MHSNSTGTPINMRAGLSRICVKKEAGLNHMCTKGVGLKIGLRGRGSADSQTTKLGVVK